MLAVDIQEVSIVFGNLKNIPSDFFLNPSNKQQLLKENNLVLGVNQASLQVERGSICVLMGLSGSGKSTLLRTINGLIKPVCGRVNFYYSHDQSKVDIAQCSEKELSGIRQKEISMVFQLYALFPWKTIAENVAFGLEIMKMPKNEIKQRVEQNLKLVNLYDWKDKKIQELSGGMQQRVGLARALATDAPILLMDEPFSALDPLIRNYLQDELLDLQKNLQKTIVFVSHDLDEALKLGNKIVLLEEGKIIQTGTPEDIIFNPKNEYVKKFVANLNIINVLTAESIMQPLSDCQQTHSNYILDKNGLFQFSLKNNGQIEQVFLHKQAIPFEVIHSFNGEIPNARAIPLIPHSMSMKKLIELRIATEKPLIVMGENEKVVGVISDDHLIKVLIK